MPASAIFVSYSSIRLASSSPSSLRIDSICLRRKYSRCCFWAPDSTSSRMRLRTCSSARRSRCSSTAISRRAVTLIVSSRRSFWSTVRSGLRPEVSARAPGSSTERRKAAMRPSSPRSSRISSTIGAVLAGQLPRVLVVGVAVVDLLHLDAQGSASSPPTGRRRRARGAGRRTVATGSPRRERAAARSPRRRRRRARTRRRWRGSRKTRSSSPTSIGRVAVTVGKTIASSSGIRR